MSKHEPIPQRVGDAERDQTTSLLTDHLAPGRLTEAEFDERMSTAVNARAAGEVPALFTDPPGRGPRPVPISIPIARSSMAGTSGPGRGLGRDRDRDRRPELGR